MALHNLRSSINEDNGWEFMKQHMPVEFLHDDRDDDVNHICTRRSKYLRFNDYDAQILRKTRKVEDEPLLFSDCIVPVTSARQLEGRHQAKYMKSKETSASENAVKEEQDASCEDCKTDSLNNQSRGDIIRKLSTCLDFYGNFVIIFAVKNLLNNIERDVKNVKLNYWYEIMAFIDNYDLPYTKRSEKILINKLIGEITGAITKRGISLYNWRKLMRTLPDDVSSKLDYRLDRFIFDEVYELAKTNQLPFDLSEPILQLLQSAEEHAGDYIRDGTNDCKMET